jgi:hypothetical protein
MTKAFIVHSDVARLARIKKVASEGEINKTFDQLYKDKLFFSETASLQDFQNDRIFRAATHLVRATAVQYTNLIGQITMLLQKEFRRSSASASIFKPGHIIIPVPKDPTNVMVFTNFTVDSNDLNDLRNVCWALNTKVLKTFYTDYQKDLKDSAKKAGWATFKRSLKRIHKHEVMPLTRALTRYTKATEELGETLIRDLCSAYEETVKGVELVWCDDDPTKYMEMYETGPASCMSPQAGVGGVAGVRPWLWLRDTHKVHPASIFAYSPHVKGVFSKAKDGKVAARAMVYEKPGKKEFGRLYGGNDRQRLQLANALKALGYAPLNGILDFESIRGQCWDHAYKWEVPGFQAPEHLGSGMCLPMPYMDNHTVRLYVEYDEERNVFVIEANGKTPPNVNCQSTIGFITAASLNESKCHVCGEHLAERKIISQDGNGVFCGNNCAVAADYTHAFRDDGTQVWIPRDQCIKDMYDNTYYTTESAAAKNYCYPFRPELTEFPEEGEDVYTRHHGVLVEHNSEIFRLAKAAYDRIPVGMRTRKDLKVPGRDTVSMHVILPTYTIVDGPTISVKPVKTVIMEEDFSPYMDLEKVRSVFESVR